MKTTKPINSHNQTGTGKLIAKKSIPDKEVAQSYSKSDCHQNINSQIEELKKGCGKRLFTYCVDDFDNCGTIRQKELILCEVCQAKLTTLQEAQSQFLEMLDELRGISICRKCLKIIKYKAYCWENHMKEFHSEINWRDEDNDYLSENWFRDLNETEMSGFLRSQLTGDEK